MNCAEFQSALPESTEPQRDLALRAHLSECTECSHLVSDLDRIVAVAPSLAETEDPDPQIWLQLEATLKKEGLIRSSVRTLELVRSPKRPSTWRLAWAIPVLAALVVGIGVKIYNRKPPTEEATVVTPNSAVPVTAKIELANPDDQDLLEVVGSRSPAMRAEYAANLKNVNAYIRDAEDAAKANPNDEQVQESVMNAYEQRAMVYEMAMDRSLP